MTTSQIPHLESPLAAIPAERLRVWLEARQLMCARYQLWIAAHIVEIEAIKAELERRTK